MVRKGSALQRLDEQARKLKRCPEGVSPEDLIAHEPRITASQSR
jgi:hypothetical protein